MPLVTVPNLRAGIDAWLARPGWATDFSAPLYPILRAERDGGLTEDWWRNTVDHLAKWRALRPQTKAEILAKGMQKLRPLQAAYSRIAEARRDDNREFGSTTWRLLRELYEVAHDIKGSSTPVFGSKLSHFLVPDLYPVIDWDYTGVTYASYEAYWRSCDEAWRICNCREDVVGELAAHIPSSSADDFPWATKITELCVAGVRVLSRPGAARPNPI